jgi:hypothetical protein
MAGPSELTPAELSRNAKANRADGIALSDTADVYVDCNGIDASKLVFYFERAGSTENSTVKFVDGAQYTGGTIGDYTFATTEDGEYFAGPFESHRFKDSNGYMKIRGSSASSAVVTVYALLLP